MRGNNEQDKLLRPPTAAPASRESQSQRSNLLIPALLAALAIASIVIAYLVGRQSTENAKPAVIATKPVETKPQPVLAPPVAKPAAEPEKPIELSVAALKSSDSDKLDMGCACGFSMGKSEYLAVSGETAIFRANGETKICPISSAQFDDFYGDEGRFKCGSYSVSISGRGETGPGFDGHSRKATLRIEKAPLLKVMSGKWLCGC